MTLPPSGSLYSTRQPLRKG